MDPSFDRKKEPIIIEDPNDCWQIKAQAEKNHLFELLRYYHLVEIEHIGSTAVPGLAAKPVIDLMAKVKDFSKIDLIIDILQKNSWIHIPALEGEEEWRKYFIKLHNNKRVAHLHIVEEDSEKWDEHISFREALRSSPTLVKEYAELKKKLASQFTHNREQYTSGKSAFIHSVLNRRHN
ncbi:GrpB family protein [Alkalihalobacillus sp. FSL R5-0424]